MTLGNWALIRGAPIGLLVVALGCSPGGVGDDDGTDATTNGDGGTNRPPGSINPATLVPADGRVFNVGDDVPVAFDVPADPDGDSLTASAELWTDDDGTPGLSGGDTKATLDFGTVTAGARAYGVFDTATVGPGGTPLPGTPEGQAYTVTVQVEDGRGGAATANRAIELRAGSKIKYCSVDKSRAEALCTAACYAEDAAGDYTDGEWEVTCDFVDGCEVESWGQWFSVRVLEASDVGEHTISLRARRAGGEWTPEYTFPLMIDYVQSRITFVDASAQVRIYGTTAYISRIAAACFPEFDAASIPGSVSETDYALERNENDDGQPATTEIFNCIRDNAIATAEEAPLLTNYVYAEGRLPEERMAGVDASSVILVQAVFW